jgi:hypothetical protein
VGDDDNGNGKSGKGKRGDCGADEGDKGGGLVVVRVMMTMVRGNQARERVGMMMMTMMTTARTNPARMTMIMMTTVVMEIMMTMMATMT